MKRIVTSAAVGTLLAVGMGMPAAHAASGKQPISDAAFYAIVKQAEQTGSVTAAQRAAVLTRPDLAATTIDPTSATPDYKLPGYVPDPTEVKVAPPPPHAGAARATAAATTSTTRDRYIVYDNWIGTVLARYHFVVSWSYNGYSVVGTPNSYTYVATCLASCTNYGIIQNSQYPNYNSNGQLYAWTVPLIAKWIYCNGGCDTHQPNVRFGVYYDGTYNYTYFNS